MCKAYGNSSARGRWIFNALAQYVESIDCWNIHGMIHVDYHGNVDTQTTQKKITASLYLQDVTLMLNGINGSAIWWEVRF